jgi:hypothetical protein
MDRRYICDLCHGHGYQVHHMYYPGAGLECKDGVLCLCERCHKAVHKSPWKVPFRQILGAWLHG